MWLLRDWLDEAGVTVRALHAALTPEHLTPPAHHDRPDRVPAATVPTLRVLRTRLNGEGLTWELVAAVVGVCTNEHTLQHERLEHARALWTAAYRRLPPPTAAYRRLPPPHPAAPAPCPRTPSGRSRAPGPRAPDPPRRPRDHPTTATV
ncbi:hypothetical protein [Embleya hyalina]|uniref:hypothetical protein n=1 Tax=Embleya hyalina TaxID=516124 RepID=UPI001357491F|nr:hypothetical protein [Embleya hyalina]